jgi:hypothetical protein
MKTIASIRNPQRWQPRLDDLIKRIATARKNHKPRTALEHDAKLIRAAILAYENRSELDRPMADFCDVKNGSNAA